MKRFSRIVPVLVGMLLLTAAVLKTENLPLEEKLHDGLLGSRVFLVSVIAGEFLLAAWLLSGWSARRCRQVTMGLFALFALVTLAKALSGAASCGCFGRFEVNPWWTFLLDLGVLSLLRLTPHTGDVASKPYRATRSVPGRIPGARPLWTTTLCLLVAMVAAGRLYPSGRSGCCLRQPISSRPGRPVQLVLPGQLAAYPGLECREWPTP